MTEHVPRVRHGEGYGGCVACGELWPCEGYRSTLPLDGAPRITLPLDPPPYVPVPIAPDAARDARVAARRAADARKAGSALSHLLDCGGSRGPGGVREDHATEFVELLADAIASRLQHNRAYGVAVGAPEMHVDDCPARFEPAAPCIPKCRPTSPDYTDNPHYGAPE